jgi:hypothetical protein
MYQNDVPYSKLNMAYHVLEEIHRNEFGIPKRNIFRYKDQVDGGRGGGYHCFEPI